MDRIHQKLSALGRKQIIITAGAGVALALGFVLLALALEMVIDWWTDFPWTATPGMPWILRFIVLAGIAAAAGWILFSRVILPMIRSEDTEGLALAVERYEPAFRGRLISSVQLTQPAAETQIQSPELIHALLTETEEMSIGRDFNVVASPEPLVRAASIAILILLAVLVGFAVLRPESDALLRRAVLFNDAVPRKTRIAPVTGNVRVPRGESVQLTVAASGIRPGSGTLSLKYPSASYTYPIDADPERAGRYTRKIDNITDSFTYLVHVNDARSEPYTVTAVDRPVPVKIDCTQVYPAFAHHGDQVHLPGDLALLEGSRLIVKVRSNKPLKPTHATDFPTNRVHLTGSEKNVALQVDPMDAYSATTLGDDGQPGMSLPPGTTGMAIYLVDQDELETKNPTIYHIQLMPKTPPRIEIVSGEAHDEMTLASVTQHLLYEATDDYGLSAITLHYRLDGGAEQNVAIPANLQNLPVRSSADLALSAVSPAAGKTSLEGSTVEFWLRAQDTATGMGHASGFAETPHQTLRIVTSAELQLAQRAAQNKAMSDLNAIRQGEQQTSDQLGNFVMSHSGTTRPVSP